MKGVGATPYIKKCTLLFGIFRDKDLWPPAPPLYKKCTIKKFPIMDSKINLPEIFFIFNCAGRVMLG